MGTLRRKITIADVAKACQVSPATVSLVLRNKPGVGEDTRAKVMGKAQEMGYLLRNINTINVLQNGIKNIGLVIKANPTDVVANNSFYSLIMSGIECFCRQQNINLIYGNLPVNNVNIPMEIPHCLTDSEVDGFIMVGMQCNTNLILLLQHRNLPAVLVDAYADDASLFDMVLTDNVMGGYRATKHLINLGHRKILLAGSMPNAYPSIRERREGYLKAIVEANLEPIFADSDLWTHAVQPAVQKAFEKEPDISAIFSCNDDLAIAVMRTVRDMGKTIPEDVSVIGFDDIQLAQHITPSLTTMAVDKVEMGRMSINMLVDRIHNPSGGRIHSTILPRLIERESTAEYQR
ncbi:MAG: LacI family DNA-binding transcriptional regulator [Anaerolineae bacterium]|jgi:LacI family transcriptional regulator|nr:LacI family DNA-binding transcriptional regulator [Anaerolineae bacterium]